MKAARGFIVGTLYVALAAGAAGAIGGSAVTRLYYLHELEKQATEARAQADAASETDRLRGRAYEAWAARQKPKTIIITRKIDHELQTHSDWASSPVPDGLRQSLEGAAAALGAADQPDAAVPRVPVAPAP